MPSTDVAKKLASRRLPDRRRGRPSGVRSNARAGFGGTVATKKRPVGCRDARGLPSLALTVGLVVTLPALGLAQDSSPAIVPTKVVESDQGLIADAKAGDAKAVTRYGPSVVKEAEGVLANARLRRSGRSISATELPAVARQISELLRLQRGLVTRVKTWRDRSDRVAAAEQERVRIRKQWIQVNRRLAASPNDNRLIAQNNTIAIALKDGNERLAKFKAEVASERGGINAAEAEFADQVRVVRDQLDQVRRHVDQAIATPRVRIALRVMHVNFGTPEQIATADLVAGVEKRLAAIEQRIFSESIKLDRSGGGLMVNVNVGAVVVPMVVDSGASIVTLPPVSAAKLGIVVDTAAPRIIMTTADGRQIEAREVILESVRVGQFEATNVRAAVMTQAGGLAQPLLGMSFLSHFRFEIDTAAGTLKLLQFAAELK